MRVAVRLAAVAVLVAVVLAVANVHSVSAATATAEAETDPHRLLGDKLDKLRHVTGKAKAAAAAAAKAAAEQPLPEYEITNEGISEVKTLATTANAPKAPAPAATKSGVYSAASHAESAVAAVPVNVAVSAAAAAGASLEHTVLLAMGESVSTHLGADPDTVMVNGVPKKQKPINHEAMRRAIKRKQKGTLSCKCTFVPLPNALPSLTPEQKHPKKGEALEAKRDKKLLDDIMKGKKKAGAKSKKPAASTTAASSATGAAGASGSAAPAVDPKSVAGQAAIAGTQASQTAANTGNTATTSMFPKPGDLPATPVATGTGSAAPATAAPAPATPAATTPAAPGAARAAAVITPLRFREQELPTQASTTNARPHFMSSLDSNDAADSASFVELDETDADADAEEDGDDVEDENEEEADAEIDA